jgi:hypothetical protein
MKAFAGLAMIGGALALRGLGSSNEEHIKNYNFFKFEAEEILTKLKTNMAMGCRQRVSLLNDATRFVAFVLAGANGVENEDRGLYVHGASNLNERLIDMEIKIIAQCSGRRGRGKGKRR